ncbi:hypothetical protein HBH56_164200 [Parastagonospora nodorum]|uniref:Uncharacterized protein n=1 Tax=Phaeosphaeria nodorum (strain SN15 / ATCC MYA-4574 / FGSC 10173) TaxID=321614 RepID=A0A7U2IB20_PHANO|nr:hypothetical protein HBH56_164200 [Parastagonospora nodorum]QRD06551.1 hypothetical protein JI435_119200 [Parastagonospora nodorum SN15]KAH3931909.1 hypothetical protein HBH54_085040 [Parastagonospora nodorum]KAH4095530.1 hypothetical protein HBH46_169310 [Parastagonospora nodorum]KAH4141157.1 hypothetical protein HBH45_072980 [Parastagonospora nodorum]
MPWLPLDGAAAVARWCRDVRVKGSRWESWCSEYVTSQATAAERSVFVGRWKNEGFLAARLHVDEAWSRLRGSLPSAEECWPLLEGAMAAGESSGSRRAAGDVVGGQARQMQSRYRCTEYGNAVRPHVQAVDATEAAGCRLQGKGALCEELLLETMALQSAGGRGAVGELHEKRRRVERVSDGSRCRRGSQRQRQRACRQAVEPGFSISGLTPSKQHTSVGVASTNNQKMSQ